MKISIVSTQELLTTAIASSKVNSMRPRLFHSAEERDVMLGFAVVLALLTLYVLISLIVYAHKKKLMECRGAEILL